MCIYVRLFLCPFYVCLLSQFQIWILNVICNNFYCKEMYDANFFYFVSKIKNTCSDKEGKGCSKCSEIPQWANYGMKNDVPKYRRGNCDEGSHRGEYRI